MERGHAEALMPLIERVMAQVDGGFTSLDRIAVTVGPGSFTGIRIGVAAARGIALARGITAVGVSTLAAFAAPLLSDEKGSGLVVAAIDARHDNVFFTAYGPGGHVLISPALVSVSAACRLLGVGRVRVSGSGAPLLLKEAIAAGIDITLINVASAPDIVDVARLGLVADPPGAPARPIYLKAPDVKPALNQALPHTLA
jgi:tRNA threonylcarbamoyl adenosine modification protein YeaZ